MTPTYEVAQRTDGSWGVKRSNSETIFGTFETEGHAQAAVDGATWVQEGLGATVDPASDTAATVAPSDAGSTAGHTPGPWQMSGGRRRDSLYGHGVGPDGGGYVALVTYSDRTNAEHRASLADARLIAAAPELLEAARMLAGLQDRAGRAFPTEQQVAFAQTAIAKATGQ